ncbi:ribosomal protein S18-alanine N-acetyltransferase [Chitinibacter sp. GC72]|uniref:ribosomal protein S18-alanine N-acetyltransferase n=1 Tax=Chitinibacter sp. GC72 TaxID=1526917 RepID=UPI0012F9FA02|nr:ribosomal protein S18-alanine N-acetyltransferase [Chitinibacter sp. GC72]
MSQPKSATQPRFARLETRHVAELADLDESTNPHPWNGKQWLDSLEQHTCLGVWLDDTLAGFSVSMATLDEAELLLIAIAPQWQGQGWGAQLLHYTESTLASEGIAQLFLEVRESNQGARAFYQRHGWHENGRRKNYYPCAPRDIKQENSAQLSREDAILCAKNLCATTLNGAST